ncbi:MAG: GTPase HflX [Deltaproteobacteria bacterium]
MPGAVHLAHLLPPNPAEKGWEVTRFRDIHEIQIPFLAFVHSLEGEIRGKQTLEKGRSGEEKAILVHASPHPKTEVERSLAELAELARTANVDVIETFSQRIHRYSPSYLIGKGKIQEILMKGLALGATLVIFDQDLSPAQVNNIAGLMDLKVMDRTQLILDIFARRARSSTGKIQVELAQLRYILPRLTGRGSAMSRLMGGIGGKGPGETKLEMDRRRIKDRIRWLEKDIEESSRGRMERKKQRQRSGLPAVSLIGYTNAGKSTLLNRLTGSSELAEDRLFATLDPATRRGRLPGGQIVVFSDTVGFIRRMPKDLRVAFRATLEELEDADLFIHVVDATSPYRDEEIEVVEEVLEELGLAAVPRILCENKCDLAHESGAPKGDKAGLVRISALTGTGIGELLKAVEETLKAFPRSRTGNPGNGPSLDRTRS